MKLHVLHSRSATEPITQSFQQRHPLTSLTPPSLTPPLPHPSTPSPLTSPCAPLLFSASLHFYLQFLLPLPTLVPPSIALIKIKLPMPRKTRVKSIYLLGPKRKSSSSGSGGGGGRLSVCQRGRETGSRGSNCVLVSK